jgi:hypothetical protein
MATLKESSFKAQSINNFSEYERRSQNFKNINCNFLSLQSKVA